MNTQKEHNTEAVFAYGSLTQLLMGRPCKLYGFRVWWRGFPSLKPDMDSAVTGIVYDIPVDLLDRMDVEAQKFGDYHRFRVQVYDGQRYINAWTYQMTVDADDYSKAASYTLNEEESYEPIAGTAG